MASYLHEKKEGLVHIKFNGIMFTFSFLLKFFKDQDSSKFIGGLDKGGLDSVEYGINVSN